MAKTPEGKVKDQVKKLLKQFDAKYVMPVMRGMNENGTPDFLVCMHGWFVCIETKADGNGLTAIQKVRCQEFAESGAIVLVIDEHNQDDLHRALAALSGVGTRERIVEMAAKVSNLHNWL